jgi:hypothetical protein
MAHRSRSWRRARAVKGKGAAANKLTLGLLAMLGIFLATFATCLTFLYAFGERSPGVSGSIRERR